MENGDADAAAENRIRIGWNKFRQLVPLLTNKTGLYHRKKEGDCTVVVCEVECCTDVRPSL